VLLVLIRCPEALAPHSSAVVAKAEETESEGVGEDEDGDDDDDCRVVTDVEAREEVEHLINRKEIERERLPQPTAYVNVKPAT